MNRSGSNAEMRNLKVLVAALALALSVPATALAVNVSSNDGLGTQHRVKSYGNGAEVSGNLRSARGNPVYYQGRVNRYTNVRSLCGASAAQRYTGNISRTSAYPAGGFIGGDITACSGAKVQSRVGRDIALRIDPTGSWSNEY